MIEKNIDAFRTISEVAEDLDLPQHVLRFWETRFLQIKPMKRGGGRRYYRPDDVELLRAIRQLLYGEGYTIKGVQRILKEQGPRAVVAAVGAGGGPVARQTRRVHDSDDGLDDEQRDDVLEEAGDAPAPPAPQPSVVLRSVPVAPPRVPPPAAPLSRPAAAAALPVQADAAQAVGALSEMDLRRLRAALADLSECERILAAARRV